MVEEQLVGILTLAGDYQMYARKGWEDIARISWEITRQAPEFGYFIRLRLARPDPDEFDVLSEIDRKVMKLLWQRLPTVPNEGFARIYFAILSNPLDDTVGDALVKELNPLGLRPIDDSKPGARKPREQVGVFSFLMEMWSRREVRNGILAAFTYELSWPYLEERKCTLRETFDDLYHWFDADGTWVDKTYFVEKAADRRSTVR